MKIDEILELLPEEHRETAAATINQLVEAERETGIQAANKKNREAQRYKSIVKELGDDPDKYSSVEEFQEELKNKSQRADESLSEIEKLQQKLSSLSEAYEEERNLRAQKEREAQQQTIKQRLAEELKPKLYGADYLIENLINKNEFTLDGDEIVAQDGLPFDAKIAKIIETNKENLKQEPKTTPGVVRPTQARPSGDLKSLLKQEMDAIRTGESTVVGIPQA